MNHKSPISAALLAFELENDLLIPQDLREHFASMNPRFGSYNDEMYCFYSIEQFQDISTALTNWNGTPDYSEISKNIESSINCFVFADYMFHMFVYAIRLYNEPTLKNEVYILCGDKFKQIAYSFTDFVKLYKTQSAELFFETE